MQKTMDETLSRRVGLRRVDEPPPPPQIPKPARKGPEPFGGFDAFAADPILTACLDIAVEEETEAELRAVGTYWGSAEAHEVARIATEHGPSLRREDVEGRRIDQVEMHPAYHALMNRSVAGGLLSSAWEDGDGVSQHRMRAAHLLMAAGVERGHLLPVSATHAAVASLAHAPALEAELFPLIASRRYDRRPVPIEEKDGALVTLALSERPSLDDYGALEMHGELAAGERVRVSGEKVFVASPSADLILLLARTSDGPTAALVPRFAPENADKVLIDGLNGYDGLCAQAIAAVSFDGAKGHLLGEPGRGLKVLRDVRTLTQLDCTIIAAGTLRSVLARTAHHLRTRASDGVTLLSEPLYSRTLADIALTSAAQTALAMRLATAFDRAFERDGDHAVARVLTAAARVHTLEAAMAAAAAARDAMALVALPGRHPAARAVPDLAAIAQWDGTANDAALDLISLIARDATVLPEALEELGSDLGTQNADLVERTQTLGSEAVENPGLARAFCDQFAMLAAASAMRRNLPRVVSDAFVATRLRGGYAAGYGTLDARFDPDAIIDFIVPEG